jgi:hypothetical protein
LIKLGTWPVFEAAAAGRDLELEAARRFLAND